MKISKIIRSVYECTSPEEGIVSAENRLLKNRFLVVMDYDDEFRGIVTTDDIVQSPYQLIEDCLSPKPRLESTDSIESVLANMRETGSFVLPVFDDGKFIGVIVETDIIESLIEHRDKLTNTIVEKNDDLSRINALLYSESEKHKAVQEDKKRTEDILSLITANMSDMIVLTDTNGILQYYSPSHMTVLGYDLKEAIGKSVFDFVHPEDVERFECIFKNAVATSTPGRAEYRVRHADGHYIWVETIGNFVKDENGRVKGVVLTSRDITERKRIEEALRESEEKYRSLASTADSIYLVNRDFKYLFMNEKHLERFGLPLDQIVGKTYGAFHSKEDTEEFNQKVEETFNIGRPIQFEHRSLRDGRYFLRTFSPVKDSEGKETIAVTVVSKDITERKKIEEELKVSREQVAMINKILRHDVTNDLTVIRSALRLYGESGEERLLKEASERVGKSVNLIRRMRELETFISSRRDLKLCNIGSTIKEVIKNYPSIRFTIEGRGQVLADEALSSVIDNIIANALIHGKADSLEIKIEKVRDMYEIRIADNGIGIPDEIKGRIFEEDFSHGEEARTGLGLYIVKKTMENYGGSVRVEDNTPKGSVFVLKLKGVN